MKVIAKTIKGKEFMYNPRTARKVSARSANAILAAVNEHKALLGAAENEVFHVYDVDKYDAAYEYAQKQAFVIRNGYVCAKNYL